tara:strand:+ start:1386 stop:1619 length:234 start_codon:yes stop_codon:yes gene_type:complete
MADIEKTISHDTGAASTHWTIDSITVTLFGYTSDTAEGDGKTPLDTKTVILTGADIKSEAIAELISSESSPFNNGTT